MKHVTRHGGRIVSVHDAPTSETQPVAENDPELLAKLSEWSAPVSPAQRVQTEYDRSAFYRGVVGVLALMTRAGGVPPNQTEAQILALIKSEAK